MIVYRNDYDEYKNLSKTPIYIENIHTYNLVNYLNENYSLCECGLYPDNKEHFVCECIYLNIDNINLNCHYCYKENNPNKTQHHISQCPTRINQVTTACLLLKLENYRT
jgi:hypothetical protein